jgi:GNAT superfamily N-acetyltransferase
MAVPARLTLLDGSTVRVRPIRPNDKQRLLEGFERLSPQSRYRRFLSPVPRLSDRALQYLTEVDHHDHEALIVIARDRSGVGVARFVRSHENPELAEAAVTVVDDWQGRGLGTALLVLLAERARAEGIRRFGALMLATNTEVTDLMEGLGPVRVVDRAQGVVEIEVALPDDGIEGPLRELLRWSASGGEVRPGPSTAEYSLVRQA